MNPLENVLARLQGAEKEFDAAAAKLETTQKMTAAELQKQKAALAAKLGGAKKGHTPAEHPEAERKEAA